MYTKLPETLKENELKQNILKINFIEFIMNVLIKYKNYIIWNNLKLYTFSYL